MPMTSSQLALTDLRVGDVGMGTASASEAGAHGARWVARAQLHEGQANVESLSKPSGPWENNGHPDIGP